MKKQEITYMLVKVLFRCFLILLIASSALQAQNNEHCGFDIQNEILESEDQFIKKVKKQSEEKYVDQISDQHSKALLSSATLPIVFHIIHDGGVENISNNQVINSLDWLNAAFANSSPYGPDEGVDTEIEFCLANQDPNGDPTNGINRVQSPLTTYNSSIDDLNMKNLIRWDPTRYINVWVVKEISNNSSGTSVAGYAYFPSSHGSAIDGIAIEFSAIGVNSADNSVFAHEMGHYLGLYHTFEGGCNNNDCLIDGDRVCDTPPDQVTTAVPCGLTTNSCNTDINSGFTSDQNDMVQNFMDYNTPACLSQFTEGQKDRMCFFLNNDRQSLLSSNGCDSPCLDDINGDISFSNLLPELNEQVTVLNNTSNADNYSWFVNGDLFSNLGEPEFVFSEPGIYEIILLSEGVTANCFRYDTIYLEAACRIEVGFSPDISDCLELDELPLLNFEGTPSANVEWFLEGVSIGNSLAVSPAFNPGPNVLTVQASSTFCTQTYTQVIFISCNEICGNGLDDDSDGLIDCFDSDCCGECDDHYYDPCFSDYQECIEGPPITAIQKWEASNDIHTGLQQVGGDIDNDGDVEIVAIALGVNRFVVYDGLGNFESFIGPTGSVSSYSAPVLADVDNDGFAEILAITSNTELMCIEHNGTLKYRSAPGIVNPCCLSYFLARCQVADLNYDGVLEVVVGNKVLNAQTGAMIVDGDAIGASEGYDMESNGSATGNVTIANVIPDDDPLFPPGLEIVTANQILSVDFMTNTMSIAVNNPANDDSWGVAVDFDGDGDLDVLSPRNNALNIWEGQNSNLIHSITLGGDVSTLPTICNLDDDPELEIVVGHRSSTFADGFLVALDNDFSILWEEQLDVFSLCNPVSFDFDNDGKCEIVHRTDDNLYILDGMTGSQIFIDPCASGTANEHPIILDIDGDGHAEIVLGCSLGIVSNPYLGRLRAYEGRDDEWAFTRPVWNQASFYNTQVRDDLTIPAIQQEFHHPQISQGVNSYMSAISYVEEEHYYDLEIQNLSLDFDCTLPQSYTLCFDIINKGLRSIEYSPTETIYSGDPSVVGTEILQHIQASDVYVIEPYDTLKRSIIIELSEWDIRNYEDICLIVNDLGDLTLPFDFPVEIPNTAFNECDFTNNMACLSIDDPPMVFDLLDDEIIFCQGQSVTLKPEGTWTSYLWSDDSTDECLEVVSAGSYWVEVLDENCQSFRDTIEVIEGMDNLSLDLPDQLTLCNNTVSVIEAQEGFISYVWQDGFTESSYTVWLPGTYSVTVTNSCGEEFSDQTEVLPLELSIDIPDTITICEMQDTTIIANGFELLEVIPEVESQCDDCNEVILSANESQWFYLYAFDANDCMAFDSVYLRILDEPILNDTIYFCSGDTIFIDGLEIFSDTMISVQNLDCNVHVNTVFIEQKIELTQSISGDCQSGYLLTLEVLNEVLPLSFSWENPNGDGNSIGPVDPGVYSVTITDGNNCSLALDLEVENEAGIIANIESCFFLHGTTPIVLDLDINLSEVDEILWTPNVGLSCDDCVSPEVLLSADQAYEILIIDMNGCEYILETKVVVDVGEIEIVLPNIFSPNGDATNDLFEINSPFPFNYDLSIFDRWGNIVFIAEDAQSNDANYFWDGRMNAQFVEAGVYVFQLSVQELNIIQTGTITVIR